MAATTTDAASADLIASARALVEVKQRVDAHGDAERIPDVEGILATVTPADQLTWSGCFAWSLVPGPDGRAIRARTTMDEIRDFYEWRTSLDVPEEAKPGLTEIRSSWYGFQEAHPTVMRDVNTGEVSRIVEALTFFTMDGHEGINSEIVWLRIDDVALDPGTRTGRWQAYLDALRGQDPAALTALMTPDVQGAVRDYAGAAPPFVAIHGRDQMREHYQRMFDHYELRSADVLQSRVGDWFIFHELLLTLRARTGAATGHDFACRIGEFMPFDPAGSFQGRCGYGTQLLPI
jgi:SnoaL-like domain